MRYMLVCWLIATGIACTTIEEFVPPEPVVIETIEAVLNPREVVIVREPQYIFLPEIIFEEPLIPPLSLNNANDEIDANVERSTVTPDGQNWEESILEYDYIEGRIYHIYTSPIRITDIHLRPGEILQGDLILGDSSSWIFTLGTSGSQNGPITHIYLKPLSEFLETTLIINTDQRTYYTIISSTPETYMVGVRWRYPLEELQGLSTITGVFDSVEDVPQQQINLDAFSYDYQIEFPSGQFVQWKPISVYDDGIKTYIVLPPTALNHELPALTLGTGDDSQIVNYRHVDNIYEIDRLIEIAELRLDEQWIKIEKKRST